MNRTLEREFDHWLRRVDTAFIDTVRAELDVERVLARINSASSDTPSASWGGLGQYLGEALDGHAAAVERLLAAIRPLVVRYCRARIGKQPSYGIADDVAQEVCFAVLTELPSYEPTQHPSFLAFVYGIAAREVAGAQGGASSSDDSGSTELDERMRRLLRTLPPTQREIVVLRVVVGLSASETAGALGMTPAAVRLAQHRALARLRSALSPATDRRTWS